MNIHQVQTLSSQPLLANSLAVVAEKLSWATLQLQQVHEFDKETSWLYYREHRSHWKTPLLHDDCSGGGHCPSISSGCACQGTEPNPQGACSQLAWWLQQQHPQSWIVTKEIGEHFITTYLQRTDQWSYLPLSIIIWPTTPFQKPKWAKWRCKSSVSHGRTSTTSSIRNSIRWTSLINIYPYHMFLLSASGVGWLLWCYSGLWGWPNTST